MRKFKRSYKVSNTVNNLIYTQVNTSFILEHGGQDSDNLDGFRFFEIGF